MFGVERTLDSYQRCTYYGNRERKMEGESGDVSEKEGVFKRMVRQTKIRENEE